MKINIKATGIALNAPISEYVEKKIGMLDKFFHGTDDVLVSVEVGRTTKHHKSGDIFRAEIQIIADGKTYYASSEADDLYAAIDEVKDEIVHEMVSKRKKATRLFRKGGAQIKNMLKGIVDVGNRNWRKFRRQK